MPARPFAVLDRKRRGLSLEEEEIRALVLGASDGSWDDAQLGAFLMAAAIRGLDPDETACLTGEMIASGERWGLRDAVPTVGDKHSTGGVGDKVSLVLAPLLAACGQPVVMLTGRALGHTGGTADKLEAIPGVDLALDRERSLELLQSLGMAVGVATGEIAPADRRLYALRDRTATIDVLPLIVASILSKKLAVESRAVVFDVKTGDGAFLPALEDGRRLARQLVGTSRALGCSAVAWITDMSQPLGRWVGHTAELRETFECLEGRGPEDVLEVVFALGEALGRLTGSGVDRDALEAAVASGEGRSRLVEWARAQGGDPAWLDSPDLSLAPEEVVIPSPRSGHLQEVSTRDLGLLLGRAGASSSQGGGAIDHGVSLYCPRSIGDEVGEGEELARLYLRREDEALVEECRACFRVGEERVDPPPLLVERVAQ